MKNLGYATLTYLLTFDPAEEGFDEENLDKMAFVEYITEKSNEIAEGVEHATGLVYDDLEICVSEYPKHLYEENLAARNEKNDQ